MCCRAIRIDSYSAAHGTIPIVLNEPPNGTSFCESKPRPRSWIPASSWGAKATNGYSARVEPAKACSQAQPRTPTRAGQLDLVGIKSQTTTVRNVQSIPHTHSPPWSPPQKSILPSVDCNPSSLSTADSERCVREEKRYKRLPPDPRPPHCHPRSSASCWQRLQLYPIIVSNMRHSQELEKEGHAAMHKELAGETTHEVAERGHQATDQYVNLFQPSFVPSIILTIV